jgi:hypothetical protein
VTDLPRFHSGSLGPIEFEEVNEIMRRLDALAPLIPSLAGKAEQFSKTEDRVMLVEATAFVDAERPELSGRFDWREVVIRGREIDGQEESESKPDTLADEEDEDWTEIDEFVQYREGRVLEESTDEDGKPIDVESDTYAICPFVSDFVSGFAVCFALIRHDGEKRYVLFPLLEAGDSNDVDLRTRFCRIRAVQGFETLDPTDETGFASIRGIRYEADLLRMDFGAGSYEVEDRVSWIDLSLNAPNLPTVVGVSTPGLTPRTWEPGTIVPGVRHGSGRYVFSFYPYLDVTCGAG